MGGEFFQILTFSPATTEEYVYTTVRAGSHSLSNIVRNYGPCFDNKFYVTSPKVVYFEVTMERDEDNYKPNPWLNPWMCGLRKARVREDSDNNMELIGESTTLANRQVIELLRGMMSSIHSQELIN